MNSISKSAKKDELIAYIQNELGHQAPEGASKDELIAYITANGGEVTGITAASSDPAPAQNATETHDQKIARLEKTYVRIKLLDKADDKSPQITLINPLNDKLMTIQRNQEVIVPWPVYKILDTAVTIKITQNPKTYEEERREVQSEPFQVLDFDVPEAEYLAQ